MRIYGKSKGIKKPESFYDLYICREKVIGSCKPYYKENIKILDDYSNQLNSIVYGQYNKKFRLGKF